MVGLSKPFFPPVISLFKLDAANYQVINIIIKRLTKLLKIERYVASWNRFVRRHSLLCYRGNPFLAWVLTINKTYSFIYVVTILSSYHLFTPLVPPWGLIRRGLRTYVAYNVMLRVPMGCIPFHHSPLNSWSGMWARNWIRVTNLAAGGATRLGAQRAGVKRRSVSNVAGIALFKCRYTSAVRWLVRILFFPHHHACSCLRLAYLAWPTSRINNCTAFSAGHGGRE